MVEKQYIKHLYEEEGKSLNEITRMTGHNYRTVAKYANQEDWNEKEREVKAESYPVLKDYIAVIDGWLEEDRKVPRKQRHTAKRVYERLRDEKGYQGSYTSVKRYVRKKKQALNSVEEGYLPLEHPEGHAQADFGEFQYYDGDGKERKGYALTVAFPYSNNGYTQVFQAQNQECLLEGLKRVFEHIGGVPRRIRFDNLAPAVVQVKEGTERVLTDGFMRFQLHYRFQADFCNPARGNEKGNVENKVGYSRRNALVPVPTITDFAAFNQGLWEWSRKDAERLHYKRQIPIRELWEQERGNLLKLPQNPYCVFRYTTLVVNKYGFAVVDTNKYGLPPALSGEKVQAKIWYDHVEFYYDKHMVGRYARSYGRNEELLDWTHYAAALCVKPGAVEHTRFYQQMPERWRTHLSDLHGADRRSALQLLSEIVRDGNAALCDDALELAVENGRTDADSIRQCYYMIARKEFRPPALELHTDAPIVNYHPDLSAYDSLTGGSVHG